MSAAEKTSATREPREGHAAGERYVFEDELVTRVSSVRALGRLLCHDDACCVLFVVDFGSAASADGTLSERQIARLSNWAAVNRTFAAGVQGRGVLFRWMDLTDDGEGGPPAASDDDVFSVQFLRGRVDRASVFVPPDPSYPPRTVVDERVGSYDRRELVHYAHAAARALRRPDLEPTVESLSAMISHEPRFVLIHDGRDVVFGHLPDDAAHMTPSDALVLAMTESPDASSLGNALHARSSEGTRALVGLPHVHDLVAGRVHRGLDCLRWFARSDFCSPATKALLLAYVDRPT